MTLKDTVLELDDTIEPSKRSPFNQKSILISVLTLILLLTLWEAVSFFALIPELYLPSPIMVIVRLWSVATDGYMDATLWQHLLASITRISLGLLIAVIFAIPTGLLIGLNATASAVIDPLIEFYRPIPPLAYLPLIVIWLGIGETSKVFLIYLAIFGPVVVSTAAGVQKLDSNRVRVAKSLGASKLQIIRFVVLPSVLPDILTGIRIGLGAGWSTLVAAELVAANRGLGFMIQSASQFLITDLVIAGILVIAMVAFAIEVLLRYLQHKLVPWQGLTH